MIGRTPFGIEYVNVAHAQVDATWGASRTYYAPDTTPPSLVPVERVVQHIVVLRDERVLLDSDLAELYGVETKVLNQAVQRNLDRFPSDFMFQLTDEEAAALRSQTVTSNMSRGGRRYLPYAFTEQGVAMLSSVLRSDRAVQVNVAIMRTFVGLRKMLATDAVLAQKIGQLEAKYDGQFSVVFDALRELMTDVESKRRKPPIGFLTEVGVKPKKKATKRSR